MRKIKRLWIPMLLGVLLIGTLVGVASARPNARPQEQAWRVLTVGVHSCIPESPCDWDSDGYSLECKGPYVNCLFFCPVDFPAAGEQAVGAVSVKRFTMYGYDNGTTVGGVVAHLQKAYMPTMGLNHMAVTMSMPSSLNPQAVLDTTISNNPIWRTQSSYILLNILNDPNTLAYGFFIHYTWM